jgi:hypothetical protein
MFALLHNGSHLQALRLHKYKSKFVIQYKQLKSSRIFDIIEDHPFGCE